MEPSVELQKGLVWEGPQGLPSPTLEPGEDRLLSIGPRMQQIDTEVMEVFRKCWLFFPVLANLVIKKTN